MMVDTRSLDHAVVAVNDLDVAQRVFERLGFNVAPRGVHPFGTHNANIYFENGFMIELLAVDEPQTYRRSAREHNTFTRNDAEYRAIAWQQGISHVVVDTKDASADHQAFMDAGISGGPIVTFSRDFVHGDGRKAKVSAKLAFATPEKAAAAYWFSCEDIEAPSANDPGLFDHPNGVQHLLEVISVSSEPTDFSSFLETVYKVKPVCNPCGSLDMVLHNARHSLSQPHVVAERFGISVPPVETACRHVGLVFKVLDVSTTLRSLRRSGCDVQEFRDQAIVAPFSSSHPFLVFK